MNCAIASPMIEISIPGKRKKRPKKAPSLPAAAALVTGTTGNGKTGDGLVVAIGRTREESLKSCAGCPMLENKECYAQFGSPMFGHHSQIKALERGKDYSLKAALKNVKKTATMARFGSIGDPGALPPSWIKEAVAAVRRFGLTVIGYTRLWMYDSHKHLAGVFMASCYTLEEVDQAVARGFRATLVVAWDYSGPEVFYTPGGHKCIICASQTRGVTCSDCLLCDGSKPGAVIVFIQHGPRVRKNSRIKTSASAPSWVDALTI